jgi:hypothetical protein
MSYPSRPANHDARSKFSAISQEYEATSWPGPPGEVESFSLDRVQTRTSPGLLQMFAQGVNPEMT